VPILVAADRSGTTFASVLPDTTAATISVHLEAAIEPDALLVTDGAPFFPPAAQALGVSHQPLDQKAGERRRGIATKYLASYLAILPKLPTPRSGLASAAGPTPGGQPACMANAN
jgi:hypothetical protein